MITQKMERAARNGTRLHLEADEVRAIVASAAYPILQELARQELIAIWLPNEEVPAISPSKPLTVRQQSAAARYRLRQVLGMKDDDA